MCYEDYGLANAVPDDDKMRAIRIKRERGLPTFLINHSSTRIAEIEQNGARCENALG